MPDKTKSFTIDIHGKKKTITGTLVDGSHYQCDGYIVDLNGTIAEKDRRNFNEERINDYI